MTVMCDTDCLAGKIIGGSYYIEKYMSKGGMSDIYSGMRLTDNKKIVIKVCPHDSLIYRQALENEYMILGIISCVIRENREEYGVPELYGYISENEADYLIMEYIQGYTLDELYVKREFTDEELLSLLIKICRVVQELHDMFNSIYHCDIKPSNIIVSESGRIVLVDYGTSSIGNVRYHLNRNIIGEYGTIEYAAPEQFQEGESPDAGTDIYALGRLFNYTSKYIKDRKTRGQLYKVIKRCTYNDRRLRYSCVSEIICELMYISGSEGVVRSLTPLKNKIILNRKCTKSVFGS